MQNIKFKVVDGKLIHASVKPRRSRIEIMLDMLDTCRYEPMNISNLMRKANTRWEEVAKFSKFLKEKGLLVEFKAEGHRLFQATRKGQEAVSAWNRLKGLMEQVESGP